MVLENKMLVQKNIVKICWWALDRVHKKSLLERKIHKIFKMINKGLYYSVCNHLQCQNFNETTKLITQI